MMSAHIAVPCSATSSISYQVIPGRMVRSKVPKEDMNARYRQAARDFAGKARDIPGVLEIDLVGSVAGGDPYPNDVDLAVVLLGIDGIAALAKCARQMSRYHHAWEVFLFDIDIAFLGRVCHRKECRARSVDCRRPGCGETPHVEVGPGFEFDVMRFLSSPIEVLWPPDGNGLLIDRRRKLGIMKIREYEVLGDIEIECYDCDRTFVFSGAQRKWYRKRGLEQPKRCPKCIDKERKEGLRDR